MTSEMSSAATMASDIFAESSAMSTSTAVSAVSTPESTGWFGFFAWLILSVFNLISMVLYWSIRIVTITIPSLLYALFSASWTVTMNATTLIFILAAVVSAASWVVRYRILNMYSRLPPEPQRKEPEIDLFPDTHEDGTKSGFSNYLDEFLSAIKIFGYLERPVFHELTRSMQTRKMIAGETINLQDEKGFCIVVDGLVEIFVKSGHGSRSPPHNESVFDSSDEEEEVARGHQRYHLLTEVRNGAPMSSLFSIMSLFTEDVKLQNTSDEHVSSHGFESHQEQTPPPRTPPAKIPASLPSSPQLDANPQAHHGLGGPGRARAYSSLKAASAAAIPPMSLDAPLGATGPQRPRLANRRMSSSAHPDIIARATVDTTIAIIPAGAFRRLIKIYPKATAHIVHVILSRFQRVTLSHAFNYLGLTNEVMQTEKNILKHTSCQLPNVLRGDPLTRLKEKFKLERERVGEDQTKGIALHNAGANRRRRSSASLRKEAVLHALSRQRPSSMASNAPSPLRDRSSLQVTNPGDLLSIVQIGRNPSHNSPAISPLESRKKGMLSPEQGSGNPFDSERHARVSIDARDAVDENSVFRASILECMFKSLGLDAEGTSSREPESLEASPRLVSIDQRRTKAVFSNNAFGLMGPFESSMDGETESVTSGGNAQPAPSAHFLANDMKDDVEIVFFPKGSILVEQGERSPGLYYVVDGFLDIGTTKQESSDLLQKKPSRGKHQATSFTPDEEDENNEPASPSRKSVALVKPGGLAGYVGSVSSYRSFIDVVAKTDVYVGFLPRASLERIVDKYPIVLLTMAKRLTNTLPRLILHIDFALEWVQVNSGQVIFHDADESDAIYIVLNGRLRLVEDKKEGGMTAKGEYGQGESVGELEVLTETARAGTLHAIRDTELVKFPRTLFNSLAQEHPNITIKISKIIASRMRAIVDDSAKFLAKEAGSGAITNQRKSTVNLRTVALLPVTAGVPIVEFGNRLMTALSQVGPVNGATSLNQAAILNHLGKHAFNKMGKLRLSQYLADLEEKYGLVVYVAGKQILFRVCLFLSPHIDIMMIKHQQPKAQPLMVLLTLIFS